MHELQAFLLLRLFQVLNESVELDGEVVCQSSRMDHVDQIGKSDELAGHLPQFGSILVGHLGWESQGLERTILQIQMRRNEDSLLFVFLFLLDGGSKIPQVVFKASVD